MMDSWEYRRLTHLINGMFMHVLNQRNRVFTVSLTCSIPKMKKELTFSGLIYEKNHLCNDCKKIRCRYINGKSFVLRKKDDPFKNLFSNEGVITKSKVENMEKRLKKDVLMECHLSNNHNNILVHDEVNLHSVIIHCAFNVAFS